MGTDGIYKKNYKYPTDKEGNWAPFSFLCQNINMYYENSVSYRDLQTHSDVMEKGFGIYQYINTYKAPRNGKTFFYRYDKTDEIHILAYVKTDLFQEADIGKLNKAFVEFWKQYIKTEEEKKKIYFSFVMEVEDDNRILKSIVRNNSGIMMYKRRYRLGAVYNRYYNRLEILPVYRYSRYKKQYEKMKKDLFIRLLNKKRHEKELKNAVYKEVGDIVGVLYLRLGRQDGCISSMKIRKDILAEWKLTEEEVWKNAVENTLLMTPPRIFRWEELLVNPFYSGEVFMDDGKFSFGDRENFAGLCLSTALRTNGAVAVFLPGVTQRLADLLNDSFYIVFTSIHEAMIHAAENVYPEALIKVMHDSIKEATSEQDFLTDKLYFYNRNEEKIAQYNPKTAIIDVHFPINPEE